MTTRAVVVKDLVALWATPVPYVIGAAFHAVLGVLMVNQLEIRGQAVIQPLFPIAGFLLLLAVPLLTMRSFAEETRSGTLDLLLAVPVGSAPLVLGKWLASWLTAIAVLAPAGFYVLFLGLWGAPDLGPAVTGFVGLVLLVGAVAGLGTVASALTSSQPVAAMTAMFGVLVLWFAHVGDDAISTGSLLASVSFSERLRLFAGGAIDTGDLTYFVAVIVGSLSVCVLALDLRELR